MTKSASSPSQLPTFCAIASLALATRVARRLIGRRGPDYRAPLFEELRVKLTENCQLCVLETGPRNREDTTWKGSLRKMT